ERDYVVMFSDWSVESPDTMLANLKKAGGYYNFQKRTASEFVADTRRLGFWRALQNYVMWELMRMDPTDFADVTGDTLSVSRLTAVSARPPRWCAKRAAIRVRFDS
ncbi:MAG: hypothetical protein NW202_11480, partial [Nitrospira sp.]|nr:hypothetical protein [Nitrospira sp.]